MQCLSRIGFIGVDSPLDLQPMIPYIQRLSKQVPSEALCFSLIPDISPSTVDRATRQLEDLITEYVRRGYHYIGLPSEPSLLRASILGEAGGLNNVPIDKRWPDTQFMVQDPGISAINYPDNVYRFGDINTLLDPSLVRYNLTRYIKDAGRAYVVFQGGGDAVSTELTNIVLAALRDLGVTTTAYEVGNPEGTFDQAEIKQAVDSFLDTIPPQPSQSVIIHIVNWLDAEAYTQAALAAGLFSDFGGRVVHYSFANEYNPVETPLPVPLEFGRIPLVGVPSLEAESIGVALLPAEYYSFPYQLSYLDSYLWAATCGETFGINDKQLKFDPQRTRIAYYLADTSIQAGSLTYRINSIYFNPRWWSPNRPVVPAPLAQ